MHVGFSSKALRDICEQRKLAVRRFGQEDAELIMHRLADLDAAQTIEDLVIGFVLVPNVLLQQIIVRPALVISFTSNHLRTPMTSTGTVDWSRVTRIKILKVGTLT